MQSHLGTRYSKIVVKGSERQPPPSVVDVARGQHDAEDEPRFTRVEEIATAGGVAAAAASGGGQIETGDDGQQPERGDRQIQVTPATGGAPLVDQARHLGPRRHIVAVDGLGHQPVLEPALDERGGVDAAGRRVRHLGHQVLEGPHSVGIAGAGARVEGAVQVLHHRQIGDHQRLILERVDAESHRGARVRPDHVDVAADLSR
jgi:hypothetical protein